MWGYKQTLFSKLSNRCWREMQIGLIISAIDYYCLLISRKITRFYGLCNMSIIIIFLMLYVCKSNSSSCLCLYAALPNISRKIIKNNIFRVILNSNTFDDPNKATSASTCQYERKKKAFTLILLLLLPEIFRHFLPAMILVFLLALSHT